MKYKTSSSVKLFKKCPRSFDTFRMGNGKGEEEMNNEK
jgi:hypothetical protein